MVGKTLKRAAAVAAMAVAPLCVTGVAHASSTECGPQNIANASFSLCTYVDNSGGDGLYLNYVTNYVNTSQDGWTFPNGQNCTVGVALTVWPGNGFYTINGATYPCNTYKTDPSYTFHLGKELTSNSEVCSTLFFAPYNQRAGYTNDCVGVHR
jgi:hypothetical protein